MMFSPKQYSMIEIAASRLQCDFTVFTQRVLDQLAAQELIDPDIPDCALIEAISRVKERYPR